MRRKCGCLRGPIPTDPQDGTEYGDGVCGCQERQKAMARSKLRTPVIVGAVVGGVVFFVVTGLMVFFCTGMRCCGNRAKDVEMEMAIIKRYHERTRVETLAIGPGDGR